MSINISKLSREQTDVGLPTFYQHFTLHLPIDFFEIESSCKVHQQWTKSFEQGDPPRKAGVIHYGNAAFRIRPAVTSKRKSENSYVDRRKKRE